MIVNFTKNVSFLSTPKKILNGYSEGEYSNFNLASYVKDNDNNVKLNRLLLRKVYKLPSEPKWLNQKHSNTCLLADTIDGIPNADASYTYKKNVVCAILTADCLPIFLSNKQGSFVGIIHAGWQGILAGVIENFVNTVQIDSNDYVVKFSYAISQKYLALDKNIYNKFYSCK